MITLKDVEKVKELLVKHGFKIDPKDGEFYNPGAQRSIEIMNRIIEMRKTKGKGMPEKAVRVLNQKLEDMLKEKD